MRFLASIVFCMCFDCIAAPGTSGKDGDGGCRHRAGDGSSRTGGRSSYFSEVASMGCGSRVSLGDGWGTMVLIFSFSRSSPPPPSPSPSSLKMAF